jgi:peroxiredoxin
MSRLFLPLLLGALLLGCRAPETPSPATPDTTTSSATVSADPDTSTVGVPSLPRPAPDLAWPTLEGDTLRLSDLRGQLVLLNVWATWCPPCIAEIPDLAALYDDLHADGLTIVGLSIDAEGAEVVRPFAREHPMPYPVALDPDASSTEQLGGVYSLPTTLLIDAEGQIVNRFVGIFPVEQMRDPLRDMLGLPVE